MSLYEALRYLFQAVLMMTIAEPPYVKLYRNNRSQVDAYDELQSGDRNLLKIFRKAVFCLEIGPNAASPNLRADTRLEALAAFSDKPYNSPAVRTLISGNGLNDMYLDDTNIEDVTAALNKGQVIRVAFESECSAAGANVDLASLF